MALLSKDEGCESNHFCLPEVNIVCQHLNKQISVVWILWKSEVPVNVDACSVSDKVSVALKHRMLPTLQKGHLTFDLVFSITRGIDTAGQNCELAFDNFTELLLRLHWFLRQHERIWNLNDYKLVLGKVKATMKPSFLMMFQRLITAGLYVPFLLLLTQPTKFFASPSRL